MKSNSKHISALNDKMKATLFTTTNNPEQQKRAGQMEDIGKDRLKALRGWNARDVRQVSFDEPQQKESRADIFILKKMVEDDFATHEDVKERTKLAQENSALKKENNYLKRCLEQVKSDLEKAQGRIGELENQVTDLKAQLSEVGSDIPIDDIEEVKEEMPSEAIKEYAKRLNCDSSNAEELRSLELALKLEAEERAMMERQLYIQQNEALRAMDSGTQELDPETMSYEQLLELEEKMGSISKGLTTQEIEVHLYNNSREYLPNLLLKYPLLIISCKNFVKF